MGIEQNTLLWDVIRKEVQKQLKTEPILSKFLEETVLKHETLREALIFHLAHKLSNPILSTDHLMEIFQEAYAGIDEIDCILRADILAVVDRDPATIKAHVPLLFFKGFHSLESYRVAHWLWNNDRDTMALFLQSRISEEFAADIHPGAKIGRGIFIDHATSLVIGETAVVEDNVSMLHEVTLGGTGKETGDRHPKVRHGVLIGAGAKILGNVELGEGAKIAACSVVLKNIPPHCTAAGVPAKVLGRVDVPEPALEMNHSLFEDCPERKLLKKTLNR